MGKEGKDKPISLEEFLRQADSFSKSLKRHIKYQKYLDNFEHRPPLTGCTGPMGFSEWNQGMEIFEPLLNPPKPPTKP